MEIWDATNDTPKYCKKEFEVTYEDGHFVVIWGPLELTKYGRRLVRKYGYPLIAFYPDGAKEGIAREGFSVELDAIIWNDVVDYINEIQQKIQQKFDEFDENEANIRNCHLGKYYMNI